ncbi:MAG: hypothetical protein MNPFHGCM_00843 [Gemmatimonadaceae bacterium]|nr:hypothetical protein [Gemmatimonadaceae bacterium]
MGMTSFRSGGFREPTIMDSTIRIQGPHERGRFAPDAWGHLLSLKESGALSRVELEQVIERALAHLDGRIALDDLRALIDSASLEGTMTTVDSLTVH